MAIGEVGDTVVVISSLFPRHALRTVGMGPAMMADSLLWVNLAVWCGPNIPDVDSTLFGSHFMDQASYVPGDESYQFRKPIEMNIGSLRNDMASISGRMV
ncbi:MAG: hypothetical protein Ct9H300mP9_5090 [Candidatus Neomarinimicrobiota bacterium]|nr:MAG: hypothetical protein Ct9H300mP9_5090 [Candidatus Neomarinimicrobiota bacterium]